MPEEHALVLVIRPRAIAAAVGRLLEFVLAFILLYAGLFAGALWAAM